jgi:hypothetical protein
MMGMRRRWSDVGGRRFTLWWYRLVVVTFFAAASAAMASLLAAASELGARLYVGAGLVLMMAVLVRAARCATVELRDDEIVIRGLRTRRVRWSQVRDVGVTRGSSAALIRWRVPYLELDDGSTVRADEIRSLREGTVVDEVVEEVRRRLSH